MAREIIITDISIKSVRSVKEKGKVMLTTVIFSGKFDQITAKALGQEVRDLLYDSDGSLRGAGKYWDIDVSLFGSKVLIEPLQVKTPDVEQPPVEITVLEIDSFAVIKLQEGKVTRGSFRALIAGGARDIDDYLERTESDLHRLTIRRLDKKGEQEAALAAEKVFAAAKKPKPERQGDDNQPELDLTEDPSDAQPDEGEPPELKGAALIQWRKVYQNKPKGNE